MGKRSNFERKPRDLYPTPYEPCVPLLTFLQTRQKAVRFIEPCAGDGRLIGHLERHGHECVEAYDLEPQPLYQGVKTQIKKHDVLFMGGVKFKPCDYIITNPPWEREPLHKMIEYFSGQFPTWLLFDSDWKDTVQASPFKHICQTIISVGRVSWEGNGVSGMDNASWYEFRTDRGDLTGKTNFIFRS